MRCLGRTQGRRRTTADGTEPCNFQLGPWQPEQGGCILTDMRARLKIPLGPIKIQREACIVRPQPSNLFLSAESRWRRWAKLRRVYFGAGDEKQTAAEGRWGMIGKSSERRGKTCVLLWRDRGLLLDRACLFPKEIPGARKHFSEATVCKRPHQIPPRGTTGLCHSLLIRRLLETRERPILAHRSSHTQFFLIKGCKGISVPLVKLNRDKFSVGAVATMGGGLTRV